MQRIIRTIATTFFTLWCAATAFAGPLDGRVHGVVSDGTGGVLPGVTVSATSADGRILGTTVTDAAGTYALVALPPVFVSLTFELEGFSTGVAQLRVEAGADSAVNPRLALATLAETVVVVGKATDVPQRAAPPPPPPPPPPPLVLKPVPEHDPDSVCGPAKPGPNAEGFGTVRSRRDGADNGLYSKGDQLLIDGGTLNGLELGANYAVSRIYRVNGASRTSIVEHTAGLLQVVAADEHTSVAVVVYACDAVMRGDLLALFKPEPRRTPEPLGIPAYDNAARILFADVGQMLGIPRRLMVIDRGLDSDIRVGQTLTLFRRRSFGTHEPTVVGDAVVVAVRTDSATIRVEGAVDEISFGDFAAPQRYLPTVAAISSANR